MTALALSLVVMGALGAAADLLLYPAWLWLRRLARGAEPLRSGPGLPTVSAVVAFHGDEHLLADKVATLAALDYPAERFEAVFVSDGVLPRTPLPEAFHRRGWRLLATGSHSGKTAALNLGVAAARGEVLLFTDIDGRLAPDALRRLVAPLADPRVGGVSGRRIVHDGDEAMVAAQRDYHSWDGWLKSLESDNGFLTSAEGKLYALRRALYRGLPPAVMDDAYNALDVLRQGRRMAFVHAAVVYVPKPARSLGHELQRRRRIVNPSLHGISLHAELLDPRRHGALAVALLVNKIVRRLLPLFLLAIFAGSLFGAAEQPALAAFLAAQLGGLALAALHTPLKRLGAPRRLLRLTGFCCFFAVANLGMALGVWDFLRGRRVAKWQPIKTDARS